MSSKNKGKAWTLIAFALTVALILAGCTEQASPADSEPTSDPVSYSTNAEKTDIPFTVGVYKNIYVSNFHPDFDARIIRSYSELTEFYNADNSQKNYIEKYNDSFFDENAIILLCVEQRSGSIRDRIDKITRENGKLTIHYTTLTPHVLTDDMANWRILIEVKSKDVEGITEIIPQNRQETVPSGKRFKDDSLEYL